METLICSFCGKQFLRFKKEVLKAKKHYCSNKCRYLASRQQNEFIEYADYIEIKNKNHSILLDKEDFYNISSKITVYKKPKDNTYYAFVLKKPLHRIIMNCPKGKVVDHINHNGLDNRKENLRICNVADNNRNRSLSSRNTSGYTGISWSTKMNKWKVSLQKGDKSFHGGYFDNIEDAIKSRKFLENLHWKES